MELLALDTSLSNVGVIDVFESCIWNDRYSSYGDFEIYTSVNTAMLTYLKHDYFLWLKESEHMMIIESLEINTDVEMGNKLIVTGRSLESILCRRIVWNHTVITGNLQTAIKKLLDENLINPSNADRKISNFIFETNTDPRITSLEIEAQFHGEELYEAIKALCDVVEIGFKITLTNDNNFKFKLYCGDDRSYAQNENPYVVFSPEFENIINSNYIESKSGLKNVTLVGGEGEGRARKTVSVGEGSGLLRREVFTDAGSVSSQVEGGTLAPAAYNNQLSQKGLELLAEYTDIHFFEGQVDPIRTFQFDVDFFMGDIVQFVNEYGLGSRVRVTELVRSQSTSGIDVYPVFNTVE